MLERKGQVGEKQQQHSDGNKWPLERSGHVKKGKAKWKEKVVACMIVMLWMRS